MKPHPVPPPRRRIAKIERVSDVMHTGTATMVMPELSAREIDELQHKWIELYGVDEEQVVEATFTSEVLTGDSADMVERARAAARDST